MRSLLLDVGGRDNLSGQMEPLAEVVETLGGQGVVVVLPRELSLDIAAGGKRLARLDDKEVLGVDVGVLREVKVLLGHEDTLSEEVLANCQFQAYRQSRRSVITSWIFLRSALGINIVAVVVISRVDVGRWQFSEGEPDLEMDNFCGRKPYNKFDVAKWGGLCALWLVLSRADKENRISHGLLDEAQANIGALLTRPSLDYEPLQEIVSFVITSQRPGI